MSAGGPPMVRRWSAGGPDGGPQVVRRWSAGGPPARFFVGVNGTSPKPENPYSKTQNVVFRDVQNPHGSGR